MSKSKSSVPSPREKAQNFQSLKKIQPRTENQELYLQTIEENVVTFGIGPAGTGKTLCAMYQAICHHWNKRVTGTKRIILVRPAIEAGEKLGFLPGTFEEKVDPYMRPFYDAFYDIAGVDAAKKKLEAGVVEIAPVAYMRGRTLSDAFVIVDEAQNCTFEQLKMLLTRLGENVKCVVNGDLQQSDIHGKSGLGKVVEILTGVENIGVVHFESDDVVRSEIVRAIVAEFDKYED